MHLLLRPTQTQSHPGLRAGVPNAVDSIWPLKDLKKMAADRVQQLQAEGVKSAQLYGADDKVLGGLNAFYLLVDKPETYGLPSNPKLPSRKVPLSSFLSVFTAILTGLGVLFAFRGRTQQERRAPA